MARTQATRDARGRFTGSIATAPATAPKGVKSAPTVAAVGERPTFAAQSAQPTTRQPYAEERQWQTQQAIGVAMDISDKVHPDDCDEDVYGTVSKFANIASGDAVEWLRHQGWDDARIARACRDRYDNGTDNLHAGNALYPGLVNAGCTRHGTIRTLLAAGWTPEQVVTAERAKQDFINPAAAELREWVKDVSRKHPGYRLAFYPVSEEEGIHLHAIEAYDPNLRGTGGGSAILKDLCRFADKRGLPIELEPSEVLGGDLPRLHRWYHRHGFRPIDKDGFTWVRAPKRR